MARARFLEAFAREAAPARGAGMLSWRRGERSCGGLNTRWASVADSIVAVSYSGPVRTLDATVLGDSVYIALRPYDLALAGPIPAEEGVGARAVRFLARPWAFGDPWVREALERADVEPAGDGWRLSGHLAGAEGSHPFVLELNGRSEPRLLRIQRVAGRSTRGAGRSTLIGIRYGPVRRFESGRIPRWIEWDHESTRLRLEIEEHAPAKPSQMRHVPPPGAGWEVLALDEPRGRDLLRSLLGGEREVTSP